MDMQGREARHGLKFATDEREALQGKIHVDGLATGYYTSAEN